MSGQYRFTPTEVPCPVCCSTKAHILYSVDSDQAARHIFRKFGNDREFRQLKAHIEMLWQAKSCEIVRCANCQFVYANPYIAADAAFYDLAYGDETSYPTWKWEYQITYQALADIVKHGDLAFVKLLEIGAGNGSFVKKVAPALIPQENILCSEYSACGVEAINKYGIRCLSQDIRDFDLGTYEGVFDVVCMFQVLEHMDGLDALFAHLTELTTENASLFIAVPNPKQREFYDLHGVMEDIPPTHIGRWNKRCFEVIGKRYGWKLVKCEIQPQGISSKVTRFVLSRFNRSELANRLNRIRARPLRRLLKLFFVSLYALVSLPALVELTFGELGVSQWVHLKKGWDEVGVVA